MARNWRRKVLINLLIVHCCVLQMKYLSDDVTKRLDCRVTGCLNDGRCQKVEEVRVNEDGEKEVRRTWMKCSCPLSWMGPHCEEGISTKFPSFHGDGFIKLQSLPNTAFHRLEMTLELRPGTLNGLILVGAVGPLHEDVIKDFFSLSLVHGFLVFRFDCGGGITEAKPSAKVEKNKWNVVQIKRLNKVGSVTLNDGEEVKVRSKGVYSKVSLGREFYLGGHPNLSSLGGLLSTKHGLVGCIRSLFVDGKRVDMRKGSGHRGDATDGWNVDSCLRDKEDDCQQKTCFNGGSCVYDEFADDVTCWCPVGFTGYTCQTVVPSDVIPNFRGNSYLKFITPRTDDDTLTIQMKLKPSSERGILCYLGKHSGHGDFLMLTLSDGFVEVSFNFGSGTVFLRSGKQLRIGRWHTIRIRKEGRRIELIVNSSNPSSTSSAGSYIELTMSSGSYFYIGGHPNPDEMHKDVYEDESFIGCIKHVIIGNRSLNLMEEAVEGRNIEGCADVCSDGACAENETCLEEESGSFSCV